MVEPVKSLIDELEPDEMGPELVVHFYDPEIKLKSVIVIDTTTFGAAGGGTRMLPDISTQEIRQLARAMTYKFVSLGLPRGGAKAGIWVDPALTGAQREAIFSSFGRAVAPLMSAGIFGTGPDMGTCNEDFNTVYEAAGRPVRTGGLLQVERDGEPLENHLTGYGVVAAAEAACDFLGLNLNGAAVAVEGFGKVGGGAARYMEQAGARVVAISTLCGALYNEAGLNLKQLFELRRKLGDRVVLEYKEAEPIDRAELLFLPVEVLVPGTRPWVIDESNAERVRARIISSGANIPITEAAEEMLFQRGVVAVPDFICNAGGVIAGMASRMRFTEEQAFAAIRKLVGSSAREILESSARERTNPAKLARGRVREKVLKARQEKKTYPAEEVLRMIRERIEAL